MTTRSISLPLVMPLIPPLKHTVTRLPCPLPSPAANIAPSTVAGCSSHQLVILVAAPSCMSLVHLQHQWRGPSTGRTLVLSLECQHRIELKGLHKPKHLANLIESSENVELGMNGFSWFSPRLFLSLFP